MVASYTSSNAAIGEGLFLPPFPFVGPKRKPIDLLTVIARPGFGFIFFFFFPSLSLALCVPIVVVGLVSPFFGPGLSLPPRYTPHQSQTHWTSPGYWSSQSDLAQPNPVDPLVRWRVKVRIQKEKRSLGTRPREVRVALVPSWCQGTNGYLFLRPIACAPWLCGWSIPWSFLCTSVVVIIIITIISFSVSSFPPDRRP